MKCMCRDMAAQAGDPQAALLSDLAALKLQEVAQPRSAPAVSGAPLTSAWPTILLRAGRCTRGGAAVQESPGGPAAAASRRHRRRRRRRLGGRGQLGRCALDFLPNHFADSYARPVAQGQMGQREARQQGTTAHHMPRSLGRGHRTTAAARRPRSSVTRRRGRLGGGSGRRRRLVPQPASSLRRRRHLWRWRPASSSGSASADALPFGGGHVLELYDLTPAVRTQHLEAFLERFCGGHPVQPTLK